MTKRGSEAFWAYAKRWFLVAIVVGLVVGLFVTGLERAIAFVWVWLSTRWNPWAIVLVPTVGLTLSGLCLQFFTRNPDVQGTEEYIGAFHEHGGVFRYRSFPGKTAAAFFTLASGGSAGLEGPSIYAGSAIGSYILRKSRRLGFSDEDVRSLMVAGAAAGVAAVFKAPLTGIVFALEVPYRDDLARQALIPSLVASVTSYLVLVQFLGVKPLFVLSDRYLLSTSDLAWALVVGLLVGVLARAFVASFHAYGAFVARLPMPLWVKTGLGGLVTGLFGLGSFLVLGAPAALGPGYEAVTRLLAGDWVGVQALELLVLKAGATLATLASGAAGGIFIPMIVLGASAGAMVEGIVPGTHGPLFPVVGMAAFLAAGYNTPIAAAVFIAETTGGSGYLIPGLVAAAVAFAVAGKTSVSDKQRWRRETHMDRLARVLVGDIMTRDVFTVSADQPLNDFVTKDVVAHRHKSVPVVDVGGRLVGMIALSDVRAVARSSWTETTVGDVMATSVLTATARTALGTIAAQMAERDVDRVPVVSADDPVRIVGIVSSTDILGVERLATRSAVSVPAEPR